MLEDINTTYPCSFASIFPRFIIFPLPEPLNTKLSFAKSLSCKSSVEATSPPTLTYESLPNNRPFLFIKKTCPLAFSIPSIMLFSFPITLFRAIAEVFGCLNSTDSLLAIEKLCQFIAAFCVVCVIWVESPLWDMAAFPRVTVPLCGAAKAEIDDAKRAPIYNFTTP